MQSEQRAHTVKNLLLKISRCGKLTAVTALTWRLGHLRTSVVLGVEGGQIYSTNTLKQSNIKCPIHCGMYSIGGCGDRQSHQGFLASRLSWELFGVCRSLFSLCLFPLLRLLTVHSTFFFFFADGQMWHARFSLSHSL